jgi:hypothetical protein
LHPGAAFTLPSGDVDVHFGRFGMRGSPLSIALIETLEAGLGLDQGLLQLIGVGLRQGVEQQQAGG